MTKEGFPYDINGSPTCIDEDVRVLTNTIIDMYGKYGIMADAQCLMKCCAQLQCHGMH